jgi:HEPN domain-containing protein
MRRGDDWLGQPRRDVQFARAAADLGFHEWACFAAHQAAEKAAKALHQFLGADAWGHDVRELLETAGDVPASLVEAAAELDTFYIPTRYPDALPAGMPGQSYTAAQAARAIALAEEVIGHVERARPSS